MQHGNDQGSLMDTGSGLYQAVLVLHITAVVFGFGPLVLTGLYATHANQRGRQHAAAVGEVGFSVALVATKVIYAVAVLGILLVAFDDGPEFSDFWVSLALLSYIVTLGISHGVLVPNERRLNVLRNELAAMDGQQLDGPPEQALELADRTKRAAAMGTVLNLLLVFIVYLMVVQPG
jgi:hypothetical protein